MHRVLLYYRFTPIADPEAVRLWQHALCTSLGLTGRIIISEHGINGTVGGPVDACKRYARATREYSGFRGMDIKWSAGTGEDFPRLTVKVRDEIVTFGAPDELAVDAGGVVGGGRHLKPGELHQLVAERDDVVLFDGRNRFEAEIGRFRGAVVPDADTTRDFVALLDSGAYDHLKDKPVVTYCTGGVRCEVLSSLMRSRGFEEVYQLEGGIVRYGGTFGNQGLWEGSLYVFDERRTMDFGSGAAVLGTCGRCGAPTGGMGNCAVWSCRKQVPTCEACEPACAAHVDAA
ncbi:rhodanese-related sulfurtransferase [Agrococcus sediminis]|uniref:tRNA uridine(34) hydroxylase n=1 Tax=Agrococcus sediminis TaxID=2599924 RepID=A0A5M8QJ56_9MICO|nr:rhodanese-related sulfurtransferase [Agrococcus sediminis]KAA6436059.1 rhodanese-related sulfurtransferase [Agrococcus sediminis]